MHAFYIVSIYSLIFVLTESLGCISLWVFARTKLKLVAAIQNTGFFPPLFCLSEKKQDWIGPWCVSTVINLDEKMKEL